jgi:hypothetical protein
MRVRVGMHPTEDDLRSLAAKLRALDLSDGERAALDGALRSTTDDVSGFADLVDILVSSYFTIELGGQMAGFKPTGAVQKIARPTSKPIPDDNDW